MEKKGKGKMKKMEQKKWKRRETGGKKWKKKMER